MIVVEIPRQEWQYARILADFKNAVYHLQCGLTIPLEHFDIADRGNYWIRFAREEDAAWFVLSYGGKIIS